MALEPGTRLGPYEVDAKIGAGGMGEVYEATDTRLDRTVAIKILPPDLAQSAERRVRFAREARTISQLNHPNICSLFDVCLADDSDPASQISYIVMERIDGETLEARLKRGRLPLVEVLEHAIQIGEGLQAAHSAGIVHRDLKPGNIMLTPSGIKLLDFGLATVVVDASLPGSELPTRQMEVTRDGVLLGTPRYMAPEQLEGKPVDARSDIFAFGAVVYEMLAGQKAFPGETQAALSAEILKSEPATVSSLVPGLSRELERAISKCLAKDPERRWQTARDLVDELRWTSAVGESVEPVSPGKSHHFRGIGWAILGILTTLAVVSIFRASPEPPSPIYFRERLDDSVGTKYSPPLAISPKGSRIVVVTELAIDSARLKTRRLDQPNWHSLLEVTGVDMPFFSPDGQWIGYFGWDDGELRKVPAEGGVPIPIGPIDPLRAGATWGEQGLIVFSAAGKGLQSISASGGAPRPLTQLAEGEGQHYWPQFLPGDSAVLFSVDRNGKYGSAVLEVETGTYRILEELGEGRAPRYVPSGHVIYVSDQGQLFAAPFDTDRLEVTGSSFPISGIDEIHVSPESGLPYYAVSPAGHLAYLVGIPPERTLKRVDRNGTAVPLTERRGAYTSPRVSSDGDWVVYVEFGQTWLLSLGNGTRRLLSDHAQSGIPIWGPQPGSITFNAIAYRSIFWTRPGSGSETELVSRNNPIFPAAWSPDGETLIFEEFNPLTKSDIWVWEQGESRPLLATAAKESYPDLSPDGRWLTFLSDQTGQDQVYVDRFPELGQGIPISLEGGGEPLWSADGREIFYRQDDQMMAVSVETEPRLRAGRPHSLFSGPYLSPATRGGENRTYDVTSDGDFVMVQLGEAEGKMELRVILNWVEELKRLAAEGSQ